ncbi:MAG TPA: VWA domain-containing protein [Anaerolineales bacterium]|nr:VWA domain-containing protein [Anaerolineales bacterium]
MLWSLLLVPLLVLMYIILYRRRNRMAEQSGFSFSQAANAQMGVRRHVPVLIFLLGVTILLISLARPQATISLPKYEGTVVMVFDVSGSMAAEDAEPTRLEAAKEAAMAFVDNQPASVRIGVVAFSDSGISVQQPSADRNATIATIERLVPRRGTSLGQGLLVALNAIAVDAGDPPLLDTDNLDLEEGVIEPPQGWYPSAAIVLFSDGENNEFPDPLVVTDLAIDLGVRVYTVGVGSPEGSVINVEGMSIHTQMNETMLAQIADTSGGQYYFAGDENNLELIYDDLKPTLSIKPDEMELTSLFAGLGMLIFLVGGAFSFVWFGRVL